MAGNLEMRRQANKLKKQDLQGLVGDWERDDKLP